MKFRWNRWTTIAAVVAGLIAIYTLAGFWLVPLLIQNQVPRFVHTELARQATIGEVSFNPYTLRLETQDLRLAEADGTPLLAVGKLAAEMQWKSLVRRAWSFAEIRISAPHALMAIAPDGKFNLGELLAKLERRPRETGPPRLIIERFALEQGKVEVRDRRSGYANDLYPIDFVLLNFSTLRDQNGTSSFSANSERGGRLLWKGETSVNPVRSSGELTLENVSLPALAVYLKSYTQATVTAGQVSGTLPYRFSYDNGKLEASLAGARLALRDLTLAWEGAGDSFARLAQLEMAGITADLARREATVDALRVDGGNLAIRRDARGDFDLAKLMSDRKSASSLNSDPVAKPARSPAGNDWKLDFRQMAFEQMAISVTDDAISPPQQLNADKGRLQLQLTAGRAGSQFNLKVDNAALSLADVALTSGSQTPLKLAQLGFSDGAFDLAARHVSFGRLYAEGAQLQLRRDLNGKFDLLERLPLLSRVRPKALASAASASAPWLTEASIVEVNKASAAVEDQGTGIKFNVQDFDAKLENVSTDLAQPVRFRTDMKLREGGQLSAQGEAVPASGAVEAELSGKQLALVPWQPLFRRYVKLNIAGGNFSTAGRLTAKADGTKKTSLRYVGGLDIADLVLNEASGARFLTWKSVRTDKLTASLAPNLLEIPFLRVVNPSTKFIIENDRSINTSRLLVRLLGSGATPPNSAQASNDPFPIRIQRMRFQNAKLDFTDRSLRPEFSAKIYELNGVITGLSSNRNARSQVQLDGRVDEFGLARIRGTLNPFAARDNTDIHVAFKNIDMVSTTPYAMKFAGYTIKQGKISLDLQYKVRDSQLQGDNKIVIDNLTLGERVDSPEAIKLPLELAIVILKDSNGRIDIGLPVSGDLNDPQFSYGAVMWQAFFNLVTKVVTAPFRALASLFGGSGESLDAIDFDPGSDKLLPPEREKLNQVAQVLSRRTELKLSVPGQYSEQADGKALKARAVRVEVARRAGVKLEAGEEPGPLDMRDRALLGAVRDLYAERFGAEELDKQKKTAEGAVAGPAGGEANQAKLPVWRRVGHMIHGEPQVADTSAFYRALLERLEQSQPLAEEALTQLATQRSTVILAALNDAGVDSARAVAAAPEKVSSDAGKPVPLKLELATR